MLTLNPLLLNSVKKKSDLRGPTPTSSIPNTPRLPGITQMDLGGGNCPRFACSSFAPAIQNVHPLLHALSVQFEHMHTCICHQIIWWCCVWFSFPGHCYTKKNVFFENCFYYHMWLCWKNNNALLKIFTSDDGFFFSGSLHIILEQYSFVLVQVFWKDIWDLLFAFLNTQGWYFQNQLLVLSFNFVLLMKFQINDE